MPFTLSHAAAALPFRRANVIPSALVVGTLAPDIEYFIRLQPGGGWGHTIPGAFAMSLPLGLATLWIFHRFVKTPLAYLLPDTIRARLTRQLFPFRFGPARRFLHIVVSMLIGIATHILWDGCTHPQYGIVEHLPLLWTPVHLPVLGWEPWYEVLQLISSVFGMVAIAAWCLWLLLRARPDTRIPANPLSPRRRLLIACLCMGVAFLGANLIAWDSVGIPTNSELAYDFAGVAIVTFGSLVWWQLVLWGLLGPFPRSLRAAPAIRTRTSAPVER